MIKTRSGSSRRRVPLTRSQMAFIRGVFGKVVMIRSPSDLNTSPKRGGEDRIAVVDQEP